MTDNLQRATECSNSQVHFKSMNKKMKQCVCDFNTEGDSMKPAACLYKISNKYMHKCQH